MTRMGHLAMPLCLDPSLFVLPSLLSHLVLITIVLLASPLLSSHAYRFLNARVLFRCLLSAVCVVVMVVVLSLCLLVTEEVAPPAFRVVHLFGRPGTPHLLHFLYETELKLN